MIYHFFLQSRKKNGWHETISWFGRHENYHIVVIPKDNNWVSHSWHRDGENSRQKKQKQCDGENSDDCKVLEWKRLTLTNETSGWFVLDEQPF